MTRNNEQAMARARMENDNNVIKYVDEFLERAEKGTLNRSEQLLLKDFQEMKAKILDGYNPTMVYSAQTKEWDKRQKTLKRKATNFKRLREMYLSKAGSSSKRLDEIRDAHVAIIDRALGMRGNEVLEGHVRDYELAFNTNKDLLAIFADVNFKAALEAQKAASKNKGRTYDDIEIDPHDVALQFGTEYYLNTCEHILSTVDVYRLRLNLDARDAQIEESKKSKIEGEENVDQTIIYENLKKYISSEETFLQAKIRLSKEVITKILALSIGAYLVSEAYASFDNFVLSDKGILTLDIYRQFKVVTEDDTVALMSPESKEKYPDEMMYNELVKLSEEFKDFNFNQDLDNVSSPFPKDSLYDRMFRLIVIENVFELKDLKGMFVGFAQDATLYKLPYVKNIDNAIIAIAEISEGIDLNNFIFKENETFKIDRLLQNLDAQEIKDVQFAIRGYIEEQFGYDIIGDKLNKFTDKLQGSTDSAMVARRCVHMAKLSKRGLQELHDSVVSKYIVDGAITPKALLASSIFSLFTVKLLDNMRVLNGIEVTYSDFIEKYSLDAYLPFIEKLNKVVDEYPYDTPYSTDGYTDSMKKVIDK